MPQDNLRIRIDLNGRVYEEDLGTLAAIAPNPESLNTALSEQPGRFAWWATLEALARNKHEELVAQLESLDAVLFGEHQTALRVGAPKEPTLDAIRTRVTLDPRRVTLDAAVRSAKLDADLVQAGRRTMEHQKDAVIAMSSNMRAEMDFRLYVGKTKLQSGQSDHVRRPQTTSR